MILDALRQDDHPTHFTIKQSVSVLQQIAAKQSFITHIGHQADHQQTQLMLPAGMTVPYDGLSIALA